MANKHYSINEEFEVTLNVKVKLNQISNYFSLNETDIKDAVEDIKSKMKEYLESELKKDYSRADIIDYVDYITFEI